MDPLTLFITVLGTAAGKASIAEGSKLIRELIGLRQDQITLLEGIDVKIDALLVGPFNTGHRQMIDAMSAGRQKTDRIQLLKEARTSFTQALGQDPEPVRRCLAAIHLACVWLVLGSPHDAERSLREAHVEALQAVMIVIRSKRPLSERLDFSGLDKIVRNNRFTRLAILTNTISDARLGSGPRLQDCPIVYNDSEPDRFGMMREAPGVLGAERGLGRPVLGEYGIASWLQESS